MTVKLGEMTGCPAVLHRAGVEVFSALYGRDFFAENQLLAALGIDGMRLGELQQLARDGYAPPGQGDKAGPARALPGSAG
jgi:opine dehydrogenase